jgi:hypothetical protein
MDADGIWFFNPWFYGSVVVDITDREVSAGQWWPYSAKKQVDKAALGGSFGLKYV